MENLIKFPSFMTMELFQKKILWRKQGNALHEVSSLEALTGQDIILLYFGHSSCEISVEFLSAIKELYNVVTSHKLPLEVIYISTERDIKIFKQHLLSDHGDWFAVPCGDEIHLLLEYKFKVASIPTVVVIGRSGTAITSNGYQEILSKGNNVLISWIPPHLSRN